MSDRHDRGWPKGALTDTTPGPVRLPTRDELLEDARRGKWQPIISCPDDRTVIVTRLVNSASDMWLLQRKPPNSSHYIYGLPATHWCEDTIGSPLS